MSKSLYLGAVLVSAALLVPMEHAQAVTSFTPTDFSAFSDNSVQALIRTVGLGADHHAYMPATPLGLLLGVDVGLDLTYITFPADFQNALAIGTGQPTSQIPSGVPVPKLNVHKGLPFGVDLGFSFMSLNDSATNANIFSTYGGEAKWAFLKGMVTPAVALRLSGTYTSLYFIKTHTYTADVVVSKNLFLIDPYVGAGMQFWSGDLSVSGIPLPPGSISTHQAGSNPHVYAGVMLKLLVAKLVAEADYSTAGLTTFGGKFSFGF